MSRLNVKCVLITGGAGGISKDLAQYFIREKQTSSWRAAPTAKVTALEAIRPALLIVCVRRRES